MKAITFHDDVLPLKDKIFRLALRITLNREDSEDVVQETLIRVWRDLQQGSRIDNVETYALTICRNLSLDVKDKRERRNISFDETLHDRTDRSASPDSLMERTERTERVRQIIDQLPEKQRTAVQLRDIEGRTYKEIAAVMGIGESDVKVNIFRARQKIKQLFQSK